MNINEDLFRGFINFWYQSSNTEVGGRTERKINDTSTPNQQVADQVYRPIISNVKKLENDIFIHG